MAKTQAAPTAPAPEPTPAPGADTTDLQIAAPATIDDAAPVQPAAAIEDHPAPETPHTRQMSEIVAARRRRLDAELAEGRAQGLDTPPLDPDPQPAAAQPAADAAPAPAGEGNQTPAPNAADPASAAPAALGTPAAPVATHRIVVRGQPLDLSDDDFRRAAELGIDSEIRLRQANAALAEAQRLAAQAGQPIQGAGASSPSAPAPASAPQPPSGQDPDALRELARELLFGDEEKVADALSRVLARNAGPAQADPNAIAEQVTQRIGGQLRLEHDLHTFAAEYGDIAADPSLATLAGQYVQQLRVHYAQIGTPRAELDLFREAGNAVRSDLQRWGAASGAQPGGPQPNPAPIPPALPPAGDSTRTILKRNMPQAPAAAGAQPGTPMPVQKTASDIVNDMRRARGQPLYA